ncbi:MAG: sporulation integral membrane protein YtvI [Clostridia bacterium]|nr:sporulation integral membrane protein YtvI [Clostridia bacterium]
MEKYKKFIYKSIYIVIIVALVYMLFRLSTALLLPFVLSLIVTAVIYPASKKINKKLKIPKPVSSFLIILISLALVTGLFILLFSIVIRELGSITEKLLNNLNGNESVLNILFTFLSQHLPFLAKTDNSESLNTLLINVLIDALKGASQKLTGWAGQIIKNLPQLLVSFIAFTLSLFYLVKDYDKISLAILSLLPKKARDVAVNLKKDIVEMFNKYLKSYGIILFITFSELFSGFLIFGIENSFVIALFVCIIDILPVIGSGVVLVPWGIALLILGNTWQGVGIIVLAFIIYIVRQLIEPKIISKQINIHPLLTLVVMYLGFELQGVLGMIFAPIIAFMIKTLYTRIKNEKNVEMPKKL